MANPGINSETRGPIAWMARNHVSANLLMFIMIAGGIIMLSNSIKKEVFPDFEIDMVVITVAYPGASPSDVENGIILGVEDAIEGIDGIKEVSSVASEGLATVMAELYFDADRQKALSDIKNAVDRIATLPDNAKDPVVEVPSTDREVLKFVLYGDVSEHALKELAEDIREDMLTSKDISKVEVSGIRPVEISVEIPLDTLRSYGLSIDDVAEIIRNTAIEIPAGELETKAGKILLRTMERRDRAKDFADITVVSTADGSNIRLGDIAEIKEGFEDVERFAYFNGKRSVNLEVYRVGNQTPVQVADAVREYKSRVETELPPGVKTTIVADMSEIYHDRVNLLMRNGCIGLILVLIFLGIFLQPSLSFWVAMGIPISFMGSFLFLPGLDVSINMITLFAYIITLGIVVDDAIVVGENIHEHRLEGDDSTLSSIRGVREVAMPVVFSVLTTIVAFSPMLFVAGDWGKVMSNIPMVVIVVLLISLFESLFILPAHLSQVRINTIPGHEAGRAILFQRKMANGIIVFAHKVYGPVVAWCVKNRWQTLAVGIMVLLVAVGYVKGGHIPITLMPSAEADWINVRVDLPFDAPMEQTQHIRSIIEDAADQVIDENGGRKISEGLVTIVNGTHELRFTMILCPSDERDIGVQGLADAWRREVGEIPGMESMRFESAQIGPHRGRPIEIDLKHRDMDVLEKAGESLAFALEGYEGIIDVDDGFAKGKPQRDFTILAQGRSLGLTPAAIGRQVRSAIYGAEALEQQRGRDTVSVMVRLPKEERMSEHTMFDFMLKTPSGGEIPLVDATRIQKGRSYTSICRTEGRRLITVSAAIVQGKTDINKVLASLEENELPALMKRYPGLSYTLGGEKEQKQESFSSLISGFVIALLVMYCLVAIPFKSYSQAFVVLLAIPFGFVGALIGHILFGYALSLMSIFGIVALSGVVINDSLVLVHKANTLMDEGLDAQEAVQKAGIRRFRPIVLTSLTTFLGLAPMIFETSMQARFLIPMALSLGFGVLFATVITLLLVPSFYIIEVDIKEIIMEIFSDIRLIFTRKDKAKGDT
ncbi:MAG: efflux RND transporter permease subunit [Thermodesulfobacteriota bacterium]|nr:efflux RND transporter permease subunit [Thermodesulfobacteriota bacterium]